MITVTMTSEAPQALAKAVRAFRGLSRNMLNIASQGAEHLQRTDTYQNRTGNLRAGTQALMTLRGDAIIVDLEMDEHYASYVNRLGFSGFDHVAETVRDNIDEGIRAMGEKVTSG